MPHSFDTVMGSAHDDAFVAMTQAALGTALREACRMGHMAAVEFLVHHGAGLLKAQGGVCWEGGMQGSSEPEEVWGAGHRTHA